MPITDITDIGPLTYSFKSLREVNLPFGVAVIPARGKAAFHVETRCIFRGSKLIVPSVIGSNFVIHDIIMSGKGRALTGPAVPAAVFSELAMGVSLGLDTLPTGNFVTLFVESTSKEETQFWATMLGTSISESGGSDSTVPTAPTVVLSDEFRVRKIRVEGKFHETFEGDAKNYHQWAAYRQSVYESLDSEQTSSALSLISEKHKNVAHYVNVPGNCIPLMSFGPNDGRWWVDEHGALVRPVYFFEEDFATGKVIDDLVIVNPTTYEGF